MPRKIRDLIKELSGVGFEVIVGGKGSHRKFKHPAYVGAVTLSGKDGADAKPYPREASRASNRAGDEMKTTDEYHKWVEWSEEDQVYVGRCPDLISGIHGDDPVQVYRELCEVVDEVIADFEATGKALPKSKTRPMMEVA